MKERAFDRAQQAMREYGILRNRDLRELGVRTSDLFFLTFVGGLRHYGAGLYYESSVEPSATALVSRRVNNATLCLLSALYVHRVFAGEPERVWVAIPRSQRRPLPLVAPLEVIRVTKALHGTGVTMEYVGGVPVRVTTLARTVVDCFRFRRKIDIEDARLVLRLLLRRGRCTPEELLEEGRRCRVSGVMRAELLMVRPELKSAFLEQRRHARRKGALETGG